MPESRDQKRQRERDYYWKTRDRRLELSKQRYENNKESFYKANRRSVIKRKYGITSEQYQTMLENQDYSCMICNGEEVNRTLAVDHCHKTQVVRGLLCGSCNRALGLLKDDPALLEKAAKYLRAHGGSD